MIFFLQIFLWMLPIQFALSPLEGIDLPVARVLSVGCIIVWFVASLLSRRLRIPWDIRSGALLSFCFVLAVSSFIAEDRSWALRKLIFLYSFLPLYFVFSDMVSRSARNAFLCVKAFVLGAFLSAIIGIVQVFLQAFIPIDRLFSFWTGEILPLFLGKNFALAVAEYPSLLVNLSGKTVMRASALFPDPHMHAFYLGIALPMAIYLAIQERVFWWWGIPLVLLIADILTFSRGGYLGLAFAVLIAGAFFWRRISWRKKRGIFFSAGLLVSFFLIPNNPVSERFQSGFSLDDGSVNARMDIYKEAFFHLSERPWIGTGLGNYPLLVKPSASLREPIYTHSLWLDIGVETGMIGVFFFGVLFFSTMYSAYSQWRADREKAIFPAIFVALSIFLGHSLVETPIFSVQVLPAIVFVLALTNISYAEKE